MNRSRCGFSSGGRGFFVGMRRPRLPISRSVGKALAPDAQESTVGTGPVVDAESNPAVIPKIELSKVAMQVLLAAVLIDALHPTLEDGEVAFDGLSMYLWIVEIDPHLCAMIDAAMLRELTADADVRPMRM